MKFLNVPLFTAMPKELEAEYAQTSRERFVPFVRFCLLGVFLIDVFGIAQQYMHTGGEIAYFALRSAVLLTYVILFSATYVPYFLRFIHIIGVVSISTIIFTMAVIASSRPDTFEQFLLMFFVPLQLIPVMTSFPAALATIWVSLTIIFESADQSGIAEERLLAIKSVLLYFAVISASISYFATQYRRAASLLEKNLEQAREEAEAANHAKSTFLATMSHEVRTPLNGILGLVTLMKDTALNPTQKDYIETIRYSGDTLLTILNDILDFSKMEAGKFDLEHIVFNTERLVDSVVTLLRSRAEEKGVELAYSIAPAVPRHIKSDSTRIRQILLNLVGNAIKFTDKGRVHVFVECINKGGKNVVLTFKVSDTGAGISAEGQTKLFQEFSQADSSVSRKYGGTGLGLAICKKIVELMNGRIGVVSEEGKGSTFWFKIPAQLVEADIVPLGEEPAPTIKAIPQMPLAHILVAEDNHVNQKVITGLLERCGHKVTISQNGREAVERLQDGEDLFALVLMDMQMPEMDGITATAAIRGLSNNNSAIPIIALTANTVKGDEQRCLAAGMNGFVSKPIDPGKLYQALALHLPETDVSQDKTALAESPDNDRETAPSYHNLESIRSTLGTDYLLEFSTQALAEIESLIQIISRAQDMENVKRAAHDLKNLSTMFGLVDVEGLAAGIESCCYENNYEEAARLSQKMDISYQKNLVILNETYLEPIAQRV